jgi:hypothetical protein
MFSAIVSFVARHGWKILLAAVLIFAAVIFHAHLHSKDIAHRTQEDFLQRIVKRKRHQALLLTSETYRDVWEFDRNQLELALRDVDSQFLSLQLTPSQETSSYTDGSYLYTARLRLQGQTIGPVGPMMISEANQIQNPFTFHWKKESWWPWSWRLTKIDHPDFRPPNQYTPGMLSSEASLNDLINQAQEKLN